MAAIENSIDNSMDAARTSGTLKELANN